jgi:ribose transport system substrate-binding protein
MKIFKIMVLLLFFISNLYSNQQKKLAYIVSDINIPFWQIISKGIKDKSNELGYEIHIYSSNNLKKNELENLASAISLKIDGLIISPINSSTASTLLEIANMNKIPTIVAVEEFIGDIIKPSIFKDIAEAKFSSSFFFRLFEL